MPLLSNNSSRVFVFGSNLAGRHGKGAAKHALDYYGAKYGKGEGMQNNSYAIPTKDQNLKSLDISKIQSYVNKLSRSQVSIDSSSST